MVRVQVENPLADLLHWRRDDFGVANTDALRAIDAAGAGVMVVLSAPRDTSALLARLLQQPAPVVPGKDKDVSQWRRNGAGAQILADLGLGKLRVLGTPRRQIGLAGYGLEIVETVQA
ncbi:Riboflavin biosynthesis protein RibBA [compost metagenome]